VRRIWLLVAQRRSALRLLPLRVPAQRLEGGTLRPWAQAGDRVNDVRPEYVGEQLSLPGIEPARLYRCVLCQSWLPSSLFDPVFRAGGAAGSNSQCRACSRLKRRRGRHL
jgi:hypothetical protein